MSINVNYDLNKCYCKKNKYSNEQCPFKKKDNSLFCGIHLKSKTKDIFQVLIDLRFYTEVQTIPSHHVIDDKDRDIIPNIESIICLTSNKVNKIYDDKIYDDKNEFLDDLFVKNKSLSVYSLRRSIKNLGLNIFIHTKQSRPDLLNKLKNIYNYELICIQNVHKIILIQQYFRKWSSDRLKKCVNETDILTFDDIKDIPKNLLYIFNDTVTNNLFAYDIRTLIQIMNSDIPSCPYTCRDYTIEERINIINEIDKRKKMGIKMDLEKIQLKPDEEIEMRMIDVFHKINLLGNYTSHLWMKNLTIGQMIRFYTEAEDLWSYRLAMTHTEKRKYVNHGYAFLIPINEVRTYTNINKLREVCLDEIERFVTNGIGIEEKKLGAMWMLMSLVEVSIEAANALPHLVQY